MIVYLKTNPPANPPFQNLEAAMWTLDAELFTQGSSMSTSFITVCPGLGGPVWGTHSGLKSIRLENFLTLRHTILDIQRLTELSLFYGFHAHGCKHWALCNPDSVSQKSKFYWTDSKTAVSTKSIKCIWSMLKMMWKC